MTVHLVGWTAQPSRGMVRLLRIAALGGGSLLLAASAHLIAGGRLPTGGVLAVTALLLGLGALVLTARQCRFWLLLSVQGVQQLLLHLLFDAASQAEAGCGTATVDAMSTASRLSHAGHAAMLACDPSAMPSMSMPGVGMWAAHLVATVATAWLLARAEAWLWRVAEQIVRAAAAHPGGWPDPAPHRMPEGRRAAAPQRRAHRPAAPRGPPVVSFAS